MPEEGRYTPERSAQELSHLTVDQVLPVDPQEIARKFPPNEILNRLVFTEAACAEGLRHQLAERRAEIALIEAEILDRDARREAYLEAYHIAISEQRGE